MSPARTRLVFAAVATAVLAAVVTAVAVSGSSDEDSAPVDDECLAAWNDDPVALGDGAHAYGGHGYRDVLVSRVDADGALTEDADGRCAVVFAAPQVDQEPGFGVRVLDGGEWAGLAFVDRVELDDIAALQRDATATANATLLPDGRLTPSG
jgi:hypothetical protein